ncbi:MAG: hypothetical protein FWG27_01740 [Treponema sp.]|jgi:predicted RND superfamily exporter protein|nr:hypothetical protein [Treponema sp.]
MECTGGNAVIIADCVAGGKPAALVADALEHTTLTLFPTMAFSAAALVVKTLSLVSALGVAVSAICAGILIPALIKLFPDILKAAGHRHLHR